MPGGSVVITLAQKRAVFPAFSLREVTLGQMCKIGIHFIIFRKTPRQYVRQQEISKGLISDVTVFPGIHYSET